MTIPRAASATSITFFPPEGQTSTGDFFTIEDVTQIGKDKDNAEYFLVTYRMNGAELKASVVKIEEKNGEPKGEFVNGGFDVKYMLR